MSHFKVGYFVGSLAKGSINRKLAKALVRLAPDGLSMREIPFADLPLYSYDYDTDFPKVALDFKDAIAQVDAVLFVTPEYNRSIPGALKNAIDWASRPLWQEFLHPQAISDHRYIARGDWHRRRAAASENHPQLLQLADDERDRGLYPVYAQPDHGRGRGQRRTDRSLPEEFHERISCLPSGVFTLPCPGRRKAARFVGCATMRTLAWAAVSYVVRVRLCSARRLVGRGDGARCLLRGQEFFRGEGLHRLQAGHRARGTGDHQAGEHPCLVIGDDGHGEIMIPGRQVEAFHLAARRRDQRPVAAARSLGFAIMPFMAAAV